MAMDVGNMTEEEKQDYLKAMQEQMELMGVGGFAKVRFTRHASRHGCDRGSCHGCCQGHPKEGL